MKVDLQNRQINIPILPVAAALIVVTALFMTMRLGRVDASDVGVLINNLTGSITIKTKPGSFFYNGVITDLYTIDKTMRTLSMRADTGEQVKIKTIEGADVNLDVEVNYQLLLDADTITSKVIPESGVSKFPSTESRRRRSKLLEAYQYKWIRDYSRSVIRYVFGTLTTEEFYEADTRNAKAREAEQELNRLLNPHGIEVPLVVPDKFTFYEAYEKKIREKQEAIQEVEEQKIARKNAEEDQKRQIVEAEKAAEVEVEQIKGVLEKERIEAEALAVKATKDADAYAYTTRIGADAAFYQAERHAKGVIAQAKAEAEGLTNMVQALEGEGGRNLVLRALAEALAKARIEGLPYATSPIVQRVSVEPAAAAAAAAKEVRR